MSDVGPGVKEIRIREKDGAFRVFSVATSSVPSSSCIAFEEDATDSAGDKDWPSAVTKKLIREMKR